MQRDDRVRTQRRWPPISQGTRKAMRAGERPGTGPPGARPCPRLDLSLLASELRENKFLQATQCVILTGIMAATRGTHTAPELQL